MKRLILLFMTILQLFLLAACESPRQEVNKGPVNTAESKTPVELENLTMSEINIKIGSSTFAVTLAENDAVDSFLEMIKKEPVVIEMDDYSGFEKVGELGLSLPADDSHITAQAGDIVLYQSNRIVIMYGSNSWNYTRLGTVEDSEGLAAALGSGSVTVTFEQ